MNDVPLSLTWHEHRGHDLWVLQHVYDAALEHLTGVRLQITADKQSHIIRGYYEQHPPDENGQLLQRSGD